MNVPPKYLTQLTPEQAYLFLQKHPTILLKVYLGTVLTSWAQFNSQGEATTWMCCDFSAKRSYPYVTMSFEFQECLFTFEPSFGDSLEQFPKECKMLICLKDIPQNIFFLGILVPHHLRCFSIQRFGSARDSKQKNLLQHNKDFDVVKVLANMANHSCHSISALTLIAASSVIKVPLYSSKPELTQTVLHEPLAQSTHRVDNAAVAQIYIDTVSNNEEQYDILCHLMVEIMIDEEERALFKKGQ